MTADLQGHEPTTTVSAIRRRKRDQRIDLLRQQANRLTDAALEAGMADDVLALSDQEWQERRTGDDPYWSAIGRDALRLSQP